MIELTQEDIDRIKQSLLVDLTKIIQDGFDRQDERLTKLFDKDFEHIKESLTQHKKWHEKHFDRADTFDNRINDVQLGTRHEVEAENDKQNVIIAELTKAIAANSDRLTVIESEARGKHTLIASITAIVGTVGLLVFEFIQGMMR